jgi:penicillin V acylase-like amidase (Ntn superfamily)
MKIYACIGWVVLAVSSAARDSHACSNFYFGKNGYSLIAHNMEWITGGGLVVVNKRHVQKRGFQVKNDPEFTWTSKYGSISLTFDGRESTGRGINEAGLLLVEAALGDTEQSRDHHLPLLSVAQWTQYQLDSSASIEDVIASDQVVRIWPDDMQSHFFAWDRSGGPAVIEWLGGKMVVYRGDSLPIPVVNNDPYESCVANGDDRTGRFKLIVDELDAYDPATASDGLTYVYSILQDVNNMVAFPLQPQWSVVFDLHASRLYIKTARNGDLRYFDLNDFDFSCQTEVEVLDINAPGSGDVRSKFVPYTTGLNRALVEETYGVYASYGVFPTSPETLDEIINFPDTTTCADGDKRDPQGGSDGSVGSEGDTRPPDDGSGDAAGSDPDGKDGKQGPDGSSDTRGASNADAGSQVSDSGASGCSCGIGRTARPAKDLIALLLCLGMVARCCRRRR